MSCLISSSLYAYPDIGTLPEYEKIMEEVARIERLEAEGDCDVYIEQYRSWITVGNNSIEGMSTIAILTAPLFPIVSLGFLLFGISENVSASKQAKKFKRKYINCLIEKKDRLSREEQELAQKLKEQIEAEEKLHKEIEENLENINAYTSRL